MWKRFIGKRERELTSSYDMGTAAAAVVLEKGRKIADLNYFINFLNEKDTNPSTEIFCGLWFQCRVISDVENTKKVFRGDESSKDN